MDASHGIIGKEVADDQPKNGTKLYQLAKATLKRKNEL